MNVKVVGGICWGFLRKTGEGGGAAGGKIFVKKALGIMHKGLGVHKVFKENTRKQGKKRQNRGFLRGGIFNRTGVAERFVEYDEVRTGISVLSRSG